jgi:tetratricopeptide (TPR) repeat protein
MKRIYNIALAVLLVVALGACQAPEVEQAPEEQVAATQTVVELPMSTDSQEAKTHFLEGLASTDIGRFEEGNEHFEAAVAADPQFALAYLGVASTGNSYKEFVENLKKAKELAGNASEAEQAWIDSAWKGFDNDEEGALAAALRVAELAPESPRGWQQVAASYAALGQYDQERATAEKILAMAPGFIPAHVQLGNSYLFNEPRDFQTAEKHFAKVVELAPDEQNSHDLMGDVYRAQGKLEAAHASYTRAAELAPDDGSPLQQRGHVNSFLGNYEAARADYEAAMALESGQTRANFGLWHAFVSLHEGNPAAAVEELEGLIAAADEMELEDSLTPKIQCLNNIVIIAGHSGMYDKAMDAIARNRDLRMQRVEETGTEGERHNQEATIAFFEGMVAAQKGDTATAEAKAEQFRQLVAENADPQKDEPAHQILGHAALTAGDYEKAVAHLEQADLDDPYVKYHLGLACEKAGDPTRAAELFADVANYNFNNAAYALIRADAVERAAG